MLVLLFLLGAALPHRAHAAPSGSAITSPGSTAIVAPRLLEQVELTYPERAIASGLHGDVSILVDVDATGRVIATRFESGPDVFREVSLNTAKNLRFAPATAGGVAVAATTRVSFHFAPPAHTMTGSAEGHAELIVHSSNPDLEDTRARTTLEEDQLDQAAGDDLAQSIARIPGVRVSQAGSDTSKPIIRGQPERRLLVLNDGVRHESQKWGADHATEIDPFSAGSISVIRGAAGARYGPDAIGGVVLVEPPPMRTSPGVVGKLLSAYSSNGRRPYGAMRLDSGSDNGLSTRVEGNAAISQPLETPDYVLGNTASRTWNLGGALQYSWDSGRVRGSWHHHDLHAGVFYGKKHSTPEEFRANLAAERPAKADQWTYSYGIDRPYQSVTHDVGLLKLNLSRAWGDLEAIYAFQHNRRQEYEPVRSSVSGPQYDFTLRTHSIDSGVEHRAIRTSIGELDGGIGLQASFQENVYEGLPLIPNFRSFAGGVFVHERLSLALLDIEAGARVDALTRDAYLISRDHDAHVRRGTLDAEACDRGGERVRCGARYTATSASLGALVHMVPEHLDLKVDLSSASRFPSVDELYILGTSPSLPVFVAGDPELSNETVWNSSLTAALRLEFIEAEASGFGQLVEDYIHFMPELTPDGSPRFDVTIRGAYPSFRYQPIDAFFYGFDGSVSVGPRAVLGLDTQVSVVRASSLDSGEELYGTPADQAILTLVGRPPSIGPLHHMAVTAGVQLVARQDRVNAEDDFAPPPGGYQLYQASIEADVGRRHPVRLGVEATNLLNTAYRDYSSLLRYYADQPGRDVRFRLGTDF